MPIIRLTQATWRERELDKIRGILRYKLDRVGINEDDLARQLKRWLGPDYSWTDLIWVRDQLIAEGVIERTSGTVEAFTAAAYTPTKPKKAKRAKIKMPWTKAK